MSLPLPFCPFQYLSHTSPNHPLGTNNTTKMVNELEIEAIAQSTLRIFRLLKHIIVFSPLSYHYSHNPLDAEATPHTLVTRCTLSMYGGEGCKTSGGLGRVKVFQLLYGKCNWQFLSHLNCFPATYSLFRLPIYPPIMRMDHVLMSYRFSLWRIKYHFPSTSLPLFLLPSPPFSPFPFPI